MTRFLTATALLALMSAPALAQSTICGGISLVGDWVGGSEGASDLSTAAEAFDADGQVPIAGHLVRMFSLSQPTAVRVEVSALPEGDPYIAIYDAAGNEVAADDDSGGGFASLIETDLAPGPYCLAVRSYESGVTDVAVRVGRMDHAGALTGEDMGNPGNGVMGGGCGSGHEMIIGNMLTPDEIGDGIFHVSTAGHTPGLAFSLMDPISLSVTATSIDGDPVIRLLDTNGRTIDENDDYDGLNSRIDVVSPLAPGDYCIGLEDLNGDGNDITVGLEIFDPAAERMRLINSGEMAPGPNDGVAILDMGVLQTSALGDVNASGDAQWVSFDMPSAGLVLIEAIGIAGNDPQVTLFDRVGRQIDYNDDGPTGLDSLLATRVGPGKHMLAVQLIDDGSGPVRVLLERYVPAQ